MTISLVSAVFAADTTDSAASSAAASQTQTDTAPEGMVKNFDFDFSLGSAFWKFGNGSYFDTDKAMMKLDYSDIGIDENLTWDDYVLEFDYNLVDFPEDVSTTGKWFRFNIKGQWLLYRVGNSNVYWMENQCGNLNMRKDGRYHFRCEAIGTDLKVYVSGTGLPKEKLIAEMEGNDKQTGALQFIGYYKAAIDNIKIYVPQSRPHTAKEKVKFLPVAETTKFEFINNDGSGLSYTSLKEDVAEVDDDGNITGLSNGFAVIQAKDSSGKVVENMGVYVYTPLTTVSFESPENTNFYVGDTIGANAQVNPSKAYTVFVWEVDKPEIAEMYGSSQKRRAFTFNAPGEATVTIKDLLSGVEKSITYTVGEEKPRDKQADTEFYLTGKTNELHKEIVGAHYMPLTGKQEQRTAEQWKFINDIGIKSLRNEQAILTGYERYICGDREWTGTSPLTPAVWFDEEYPGFKDTADNADITQFVLCTSYFGEVDSILDQVKYVREMFKGKELCVELGNEVYAISRKDHQESAEDYFKWAVEVADAIHAYDPDIKCIACAMDASGETNILADPNNTAGMLEGNWAYTQGGRVAQWNGLLTQYKDHFDGITIHDYCATEYGEGYSEEDFVRMGYAWTECNAKLIQNLYERTGLKMYHTESGNLAANMFWAGGMTDDDKTRYQWQAYPFAGLRYFEQMLDMALSGCSVSANYHFLNDVQGFGVTDHNYKAKYPVYYALKEMANILSDTDTAYTLNAPDDNYYVMERPFYNGSDMNQMVNNVKAWGFGTENGVTKVVIANHSNVKQTVSLKGAQIKPTWSYGGDPKQTMPDWMRNKNYSGYLVRAKDIASYIVPNEISNGRAADKYEIEPYTTMVFDVVGTCETLQDTTAGKVTGYAERVLENSLALAIGKPYAYRDNIKVDVDAENSSVAPVIKNDRTLLPLRFVSESFGCEVEYDGATQGITIKGDGIDIAMTVGKAEYTVNGEKKAFDVPAEVENGRTLVPLRALAEALGKEVYWDARGLIVIYPPMTGFVTEQEWFNNSMQPHVDSIVGLFN